MGPTDDSAKICDFYESKYSNVKVIHKGNEGVSITRQIGVSVAKGAYLGFIDADDWLSNNYVSKIITAIHANPDIICFGCYSVRKDDIIKKPFPLKDGFYNKQKIEELIFPALIEDDTSKSFPNQLWNKVVRKELYELQQVKNVKIIMGEDAACIKPCIFHSSTLMVLDDCLYYYRINPESVTCSKKPFPWDGPILIYNHYIHHIDTTAFDFQQQINRNFIHNLFNVAVSRFNCHKSMCSVFKEIKKNIGKTEYSDIVSHANFKLLSAGWLAHIAVKYKILPLIWIYWRITK